MKLNVSVSSAVRQARSLQSEGHLLAAIELLEETAREHAAGCDVELYRELVGALARHGAWRKADEVIDRALAHAQAADPATRAALLERKAWIAFRSGRLKDAQHLASDALRVAVVPHFPPDLLAALHNTLGGVAWQQGRLEDAARHVEESETHYEDAGDTAGRGNAAMNLGVLRFTQGLWREAALAFDRAGDLLKTHDTDSRHTANQLNLCVLKIAMGHHTEARRSLVTLAARERECGHRFEAAHAELVLARLDLIEGRVDDACKRVDALLKESADMSDDEVVRASWLKASVCTERGANADAVHYAIVGRSVARNAHLVESEADCCRTLAIAYIRDRKYPEAKRALEDSVALADRIDDRYRRALALLEFGTLYEARRGSREATRDTLREAAQLFENLGAKHDLTRARTLMKELGLEQRAR